MKNQLNKTFTIIVISALSMLIYSFTENSNSNILSNKNTIWGIDISHHQKNINWNNLDHKKPHFVFLKATEGASHCDTKYNEHKKILRQKEILNGSYHFFSYTTSGKKQSDFFMKIAKFKKGDLAPVLDVEFKKNMPLKHKVRKELLAFINNVETKLGVKPIIYCEYDFYKKYLKDDLKDQYPLWISDFYREPKNNYTFWQKTDKFKHPAFKGNIDYNIFNGSLSDLEKLKIK